MVKWRSRRSWAEEGRLWTTDKTEAPLSQKVAGWFQAGFFGQTRLHLWTTYITVKQHPPLLFMFSMFLLPHTLGPKVSALLDFPCSSLQWDLDLPPEKKMINLSSLSALSTSSLFKAPKKKGYFSNEAPQGMNVSARLQKCAQQKIISPLKNLDCFSLFWSISLQIVR